MVVLQPLKLSNSTFPEKNNQIHVHCISDMVLTNKVPCICYRSIASLSQNDFNLVSFVSKGKDKAWTNQLLNQQI